IVKKHKTPSKLKKELAKSIAFRENMRREAWQMHCLESRKQWDQVKAANKERAEKRYGSFAKIELEEKVEEVKYAITKKRIVQPKVNKSQYLPVIPNKASKTATVSMVTRKDGRKKNDMNDHPIEIPANVKINSYEVSCIMQKYPNI
ncbi:unnamed protein product, partial [Allacma fusca]